MLIIYKGIFLKLWSKVLQIFLFSLYFSSLNLKYLKLTKMDITRFAMKLFIWWWIKKQLGIQKFWTLLGYYQDIYNWISPMNKLSGVWFVLTQQSMGEMSMVNPVNCLFSILWLDSILPGHIPWNMIRGITIPFSMHFNRSTHWWRYSCVYTLMALFM